MAEFHDELRAWLARCSADPTRFPARAFRQGPDEVAAARRSHRPHSVKLAVLLALSSQSR